MGKGGVGGWWCSIGGFRRGKWALGWTLAGGKQSWGMEIDHALGVSLGGSEITLGSGEFRPCIGSKL